MSFNIFATNELINATRAGDVQRMRAALQVGANPDAVASDQPLVCFAAHADICGDDALGVLLQAGADPNQPDYYHGQDDERILSAFSFAVIKCKWRRADMLIKSGADVDFQQQKGVSMTALFHAIRVDLMRNETTRTACVLNFKPDVSLHMLTNGVLPKACTVIEYLQHRQQQEPDKQAAIGQLLAMIARNAVSVAAATDLAQAREATIPDGSGEERTPHICKTAVTYLKQRAHGHKGRFKL